MSIDIEQIKKLREMTGVSMTACKSALEEANGDLEEAVTVLRKKGEAKAADRAGRSTSQGAIAIRIEGNKAAMVHLGCETDFVARGDDFLGVVNSLVDKLLKGEIKPEDREVPEVKDAVLRCGENIQIENMALVEGEVLGDYVHSNKKIGVIVVLEGGNSALAKEIAMHAAATNPEVVSPDQVPQELVDKEKEIWAEQLQKEGKPAEVLDKIMMGKEKKFREENALTMQPFVKDPSKTVAQIAADGGATVKSFVRFAI